MHWTYGSSVPTVDRVTVHGADWAPTAPWLGHERGSRGYRRIAVALFAAGVATFAQLYSVQAVLPAMAGGLDLSAPDAALSVSVATGALAVSVVGWSAAADRFGRVPAMVVSVVLATALGFAVPLAGDLSTMLVLRVLQGAALGGLPAIAMAYLAEEVHAREVALAAGAYVSGNSLGGLTGRIVSSGVADLFGWRWGVAAVAVVGLAATVLFCSVVPRSRGFVRQPTRAGIGRRVRQALSDPSLLVLFAQALLLMGGFVTIYNYLGFRLLAAPFSLSQAVVGFLFVVYLAGTASSNLAGRLARHGRLRVLLASISVFALGCLLTLSTQIVVVVAGLVLLTAGFFAAHALASGWVGARAEPTVRAQASALYTFAYYAGSSLVGWLGGFAYGGGGWSLVVGVVVALAGCAAVLAPLGLRSRTPGGTVGV